jgi:hypothetical protein
MKTVSQIEHEEGHPITFFMQRCVLRQHGHWHEQCTKSITASRCRSASQVPTGVVVGAVVGAASPPAAASTTFATTGAAFSGTFAPVTTAAATTDINYQQHKRNVTNSNFLLHIGYPISIFKIN